MSAVNLSRNASEGVARIGLVVACSGLPILFFSFQLLEFKDAEELKYRNAGLFHYTWYNYIYFGRETSVL